MLQSETDNAPEPSKFQQALRRLADSCDASGRSFPPLPNGRFDAAHEAFERSSTQQGEILRSLSRVATSTRLLGEGLRVLSVGPGNGMLDVPLIRELASAGRATRYVGVDPSDIACRRFREAFESLDQSGVSLDVRCCGIDDFLDTQPVDLIHAVHSLYYVPDTAATLDRLLVRLATRGRLVVYKAPRGALNALAEQFWQGDDSSTIWFSDRLESWLRGTGRVFETVRIEAWLDVSSVFYRDDPKGSLILDFLLHTASSDLSEPLREKVLACIEAMSRREGEQLLAPHPVDAFVISQA